MSRFKNHIILLSLVLSLIGTIYIGYNHTLISNAKDVYRDRQYADYTGLEISRRESLKRYEDCYSIIGFLNDGFVVCDGYARAMKWMLNYLGVDCVVQLGYAGENHISCME